MRTWRALAPARGAFLLSLALLASCGAWLVGRSVAPTDGAPVLTDGGYAAGFTVDPLAQDPTSLEPGDVVTSLDGASVDSLLRNKHHSLPALKAGETWHYRVLRDGRAETVTVEYRDGGLVLERLRAGSSVLLVALLLVLFGGWTVVRRPDHPAAGALLVLGAGLTSYQVFQLLSTTMGELPRARLLFAFGVAGHVGSLAVWTTAAAHLALSLPDPIPILRRHPAMPAIAYAAMVAATAGAQGGAVLTGAVGLRGLDTLYTAMEVLLYALSLITIAGLLRTIWRAIRDPLARRQGALVALGMAITFLVLTWGNTFAKDEDLPAWFPVLAFLPMPAALAVAIVRGEFLDLRATINRALVFTTVTASLLGIYAVIAVSVGAIVGSRGIAAALPATAVVAVALAPVRAALQRGVDRVIYGHRGDPARVLADLGRRLDSTRPPKEVLATVAETTAEALRLPYVAIHVTTDGVDRLACERGEPSGTTEEFPLTWLDRRVGALVVAPRRGQRALDGDDRSLLGDVARQLAVAVDASRLVIELEASRHAIAVARESERAQLRSDLHDRLGSQLTGLSLQLDALGRRAVDGAVASDARKAYDEAQRALDEVRRITRGLRPAELDELGLGAAVAAMSERLAADGGWTVDVDTALHLPAIPQSISSAAYHIATEALTNAHRHSGATGATVRLGVTADASHLIVEVVDSGHGVADSHDEGVGLPSMRTRAAGVGGELEFCSTAAGTTVRARLPLR